MTLLRLTVQTGGPGCHDITDRIAGWLGEIAAAEGVVTVFLRHTSASLLIQENADPDVQRDLLAWLDRLAPPADAPSMGWITHRAEGPDDMPAHIKAAVLPTSLQIPVADGRMVLGTWQGIYLVEHRRAPHRREVVAKFQAG
ncbi:secondary thiamine-phosphate synthase enzyme YjbQ [Paracoccus yeei]|uniref:secondary thiamine-phosphate synthase enzyme YjbQ n=1 Tax=Paracoccus yeei TaxID=147645 RepID=UPI00048BE1D1|nr:secondary thiamine-phosphate synthase enzyme YjbQ [Paracoccus yeei]OWJ93512.1 secondary thiamine-phosphate synthase [Paracoccus yeei]